MAFEITRPLQQHKDEATSNINALAGEKILTRYPQYKQANMTARAVELQSLNQVGSIEWLAIQAAWDWVKIIRTASNTANSAIVTAATVSEIRLIENNFVTQLQTL
jgi:hypothetical protein